MLTDSVQQAQERLMYRDGNGEYVRWHWPKNGACYPKVDTQRRRTGDGIEVCAREQLRYTVRKPQHYSRRIGGNAEASDMVMAYGSRNGGGAVCSCSM